MFMTPSVEERVFLSIAGGRQTILPQLFDDYEGLLDIGSTIFFKNRLDEEEQIATEVTALYRFADFQTMFKELSLSACGYSDNMSIEDACNDIIYRFSRDKMEKSDALGIKLQLKNLRDAKTEETVDFYNHVIEYKQSKGEEIDIDEVIFAMAYDITHIEGYY